VGLVEWFVILAVSVVAIPVIVLGCMIGAEAATGRRTHKPGQRNDVTGDRMRAWWWLLPAVALCGVVLIYPTVDTIRLSLRDGMGESFVGFDNFAWAFGSALRGVLLNNLLWIVALPAITLVMSFSIALLGDRVRYEKYIRTVIMVPAAVSFVVSGAVWRLVYGYKPPGSDQTGLLNELWTKIPGVEPIPWLQDPGVNNFALIFIACWLTLGTSTLILTAGIKNVPGELLEAARLDGASEWRVIGSIIVPSVWPTIVVVLTTQLIFALKTFDIVFVMTNGSYGTDIVANRMYSELFVASDYGHASALAVLLLIVALPVMFLNLRHFSKEHG
jgi:alpha-glucoside transport system permease protein